MVSSGRRRVLGGYCLTALLSLGCVSQFDQAVALHNAGRYPEAIAGYQAALQQEPWNEVAQRDLGLAFLAVQQYPAASQAFGAALRLDPRDWVAHYNLGITLHRLGRYYPAMQELVSALRLNPWLYGAHYELGELCGHIFQYQCAITEFTTYLQRTPRVPAQRNSILRATYELRQATAELAFLEAQRRAREEAEQRAQAEAEQRTQAELEENLRINAERLRALETERVQARQQAAAYQEQHTVLRHSADAPMEKPSEEPGLSEEQEAVLAIVATAGCEALRRNGEESAGHGDAGDRLLSFIKRNSGMACRDEAIATALEKLFPRLNLHARVLLKQIAIHLLEGDFKPGTLGRDVIREEMVEYIKAKAPDLEEPAKFANFFIDVYLQQKGG